ncbi:uncharacterized protein LOC142520406 [Primulina tabacum]|uniref:uncharacterized protein LOC142520406 n=1 Tax=Primulina tabacum TaxID=48773 RepID=UPI003F5A5D92
MNILHPYCVIYTCARARRWSMNYEVGELAWGNYNSQPAVPLHGHGGIQLLPQTKPTWSSTRMSDTLESLVHQATFSNTTQLRHRGDLRPSYSASIPTSSAGKWVVGSSKSSSSFGIKWRENSKHIDMGKNLAANISSMTTSSCGKWREKCSYMLVEHNDHEVKTGSMPTYSGLKICSMGDHSGGKRTENSSSCLVSKRIRSDSEKYLGKNCFQVEERGSSAGGGETFWEENTDTTDDSACQYFLDEEFGNQEESARSQTAARLVHNQSERRRRDKINEKMKALQKLVPNANKLSGFFDGWMACCL